MYTRFENSYAVLIINQSEVYSSECSTDYCKEQCEETLVDCLSGCNSEDQICISNCLRADAECTSGKLFWTLARGDKN